jgi:hypothetical protein
LTLDEVDLIDIEGDNVNKNNVNLLAGIGYFFNDHVGIELRYSYAPFSVVDYNNSATFSKPYVVKLLTFRTVYMF